MNTDAQMILLLLKLYSNWDKVNIYTNSQDNSSDELLFASLLENALKSSGTSSISAQPSLPTGNISSPNNITSNTQQGPFQNDDNTITKLIKDISQKYGVDEKLITEVIRAESDFNPQSISPVGAKGLMQLMPGTAADYGVKDSFNPAQNIEGGTHLLRDLLDRYNGNVSLALAAYNAGPGAVAKYQGVPPYKETQNYVEKITSRLSEIDEKV